MVLVCSNVATATVDSDELSADQLRRLGDLAQQYDIKVAFEALAWGRFVDDYRRAWRIVQLADHPASDSAWTASTYCPAATTPSASKASRPTRSSILQLADAPALTMDVLSWSRHHRLFPGEGHFDLATFVSHVLATGYDGPLSLEVFNDTFRQTDPDRTAVHALRSLVWLQDKWPDTDIRRTAHDLHPLTDAKPPNGFDFVELKAEDTSEVEMLLEQLGFTPRGRHRTKPVSLWTAATPASSSMNSRRATWMHMSPRSACRCPTRTPHRDAGRGSDGSARLPTHLCLRTAAWAAPSPRRTEIFWVTAPPTGCRRRGSTSSRTGAPD